MIESREIRSIVLLRVSFNNYSREPNLMPTVEIIAIGTELLLGEIQDTNTHFLARQLRDHGLNLFRTTMIGDNAKRVAELVNEALSRADIVITTGGLGPTVDDPTREALAIAFGVEIEYHPALWEQIQNRFMRFSRTPTENNKRQAYIPAGGIAVENPVGTAPCFIMERGDKCVFCLPGVPKEMEYLTNHALLPYLIERYQLSDLIKARVLHTIGLGESSVDDVIGDLELLTNPTVGLLAKSGQVDVRITAKAASEAQADAMIDEVERTIRQRLGSAIYGVDAETIADAVSVLLLQDRIQALVEVEGLDTGFIEEQFGKILSKQVKIKSTGDDESFPIDQNALRATLQMKPEQERHEIYVETFYRGKSLRINRSFGGHHQLAPQWAMNALFAGVYQALITEPNE
jgi:nicotinamide-nucleotide amidase